MSDSGSGLLEIFHFHALHIVPMDLGKGEQEDTI